MPASPTNVLRRHEPARSTLLIDRFMSLFIQIGGVSVITVVLGIFVFILWQVLPLFAHAKVDELQVVQLEPGDYRTLGLDDYGELPFLLDRQGGLRTVDLAGNRGIQSVNPGFSETKNFTAFSYDHPRQDLVYGTDDGHASIVDLEYQPVFEGDSRRIELTAQAGPFIPVGRPGHPLRAVSYGDGGEYKLIAAIQEVESRTELHAASLVQERTLFGEGEIEVNRVYDLSRFTRGTLQRVLVSRQADSIVVCNDAGEVFYFYREGEEYALRQEFKPFADLSDPAIGSIDYLFGDVTLVFTSPSGLNRLFSLYIHPRQQQRLFGQTKEFPPLPGAAGFYASSTRNKAFLLGHRSRASLRYGTTEALRWESTLPFEVALARLGGKYDRLAFLDTTHRLHLFDLRDPHPEASFKAMFGKIWYEGASEPKFEWQSTGGSDEFERAVERELAIALRYAGGLKRRGWGIRAFDASDIAIELFIRVQERMPGSQLAERASIELADFYYKRREIGLASEAYGLYIENFPDGPNARHAARRRIYADIARFKGPEYDASGLLDAQVRIRRYEREYPADSAQTGINSALVERLDESLAAQQLVAAEYYLQTRELAAARLTLRRLATAYPRTTAAQTARQIMESRGWELPAAAEPPQQPVEGITIEGPVRATPVEDEPDEENEP